MSGLKMDYKRLIFIYQTIGILKLQLESQGSTLMICIGKPEEVFRDLLAKYEIASVFAGVDYEPYSLSRDQQVRDLCRDNQVEFHCFHDHVIFHPNEILKPDHSPYHVFTPYSRNWIRQYQLVAEKSFPSEDLFANLLQTPSIEIPPEVTINFQRKAIAFPSMDIDNKLIENYHLTRDFPAMNGTTHLGIHLRFGTISIRKLARTALSLNSVFLNELIWREFYQMILYHYPSVVTHSFRKGYDRVEWLNRPGDFAAWSEGKTGYPFVDAGMRQLVSSGFMHNRVRMITASFLTKHLLVDWRWGEAFFAQYLLDYELASNNGGWQWAAGSGCDAAPYFRVFSPQRQQDTYDAEKDYIKLWLPEYRSAETYIKPIIEHAFARERAITFLRNAQRS